MTFCPECQGELPDAARFCPQCGAPQAGRDPDRGAPAHDPQGRDHGLYETCEVDWWHGYVKAEFYAEVREPDGRLGEVVRSPSFRWRWSHRPSSQDHTARKAYEALVDKLIASGWESTGVGASWFAQRFRRRTPRLETAHRVETAAPHRTAAPDRTAAQAPSPPRVARPAAPQGQAEPLVLRLVKEAARQRALEDAQSRQGDAPPERDADG